MQNNLRLFISYARDDNKKNKIATLIARLSKYDCWVDWEDIAAGTNWEEEIEKGIAQADVFVFFLSENSAKSEWCNKELEKAIEYGKKIIPILFENNPPSNTPECCKKIQYCLPEQIENLDKLLNLRIKDTTTHTNILLKGLEWKKKGKINAYLLKEKMLYEAVLWLKNSDDELPIATQFHREYVLISQLAEHNKIISIAILLLGVISITNAFFAFDSTLQVYVRQIAQAILTVIGLIGVVVFYKFAKNI